MVYSLNHQCGIFITHFHNPLITSHTHDSRHMTQYRDEDKSEGNIVDSPSNIGVLYWYMHYQGGHEMALTEQDKEKFQREVHKMKTRGEKCVWYDHSAKDMNRDELLAFIGFLDEQLTTMVTCKIEPVKIEIIKYIDKL